MTDKDLKIIVGVQVFNETARLKNELDAAVEHAQDLIRQRNEARDLSRRLLEALSLKNSNIYGISAWVLEEHGPVECHKIEAVLAAVRWKAGL